jgi:HprK-related kinase A
MSDAASQVARVGDLTQAELSRRLGGDGLAVRIGPFDAAIHAHVPQLVPVLRHLYNDYPLLPAKRERSFHVRVERQWQFLPKPRRVVRFLVDGRAPHADMPLYQAPAVLEWGINLVIALRYHCFLMLHAAVVEREGFALVLPAAPGSGKTTLCAALIHRGWRLLSDEFGIVRPGTIDFLPIPRPMPLKNESIPLIQDFAPEASWGPVIPNTRKGTIRHLRPSRADIDQSAVPAPLRWVVFPQWRANAALDLRQIPPVEGFARIASNAFNYEMLGHEGFSTVKSLINACGCFTLEYSRLDDAISVLDAMVRQHAV